MPHPGAGSLRTSRHIALEKGTDPSGFEAGVGYCSHCGHPTGGDLPHSHYEEQEPEVKEGSHPQQLSPFKLGS